jgi:hypothetical protein
MTIDRLTAALADRYRIERELGAGGMATVYLAHDVRHDRKVAVKVLRPELAAVIGADRFLSEIKTTANLQHPHILPLFDSGIVTLGLRMEDGAQRVEETPSTLGAPSSVLFYVMPFIDGESLRDRLSREKHLPIADAVRIATEVAGALDYAHRHGIVHRDIKPENILLHDGRALVADFGIALAASTAGTRMTETGMSLGTPTYMSPEQAMGERTLDARTDVYALGCVTYEMLVGDPPFLGSTAQAIVAKVMTESPTPPSRARNTIPDAVEDAVLIALAKLPADRFPSAAAFASALSSAGGTQHHTRSTRAVATTGPWRMVSAGLGVLALALLTLAAWALSQRGGHNGPLVFDAAMPDTAAINFGATTHMTTFGTGNGNLAISPDGRFLVYPVGRGESTVLWYRDLHDGTGRAIAGTEGAGAPRISPDGARIAFVVTGHVMVIPVAGGEARRLVAGGAPVTLEWVSPTRLMMLHNQGHQLSWIDTDAGASTPITIPRCVFGQWLEAEQLILCGQNESGSLIDPATGSQVPLRRSPEGQAAGSALVGVSLRMIDDRYLIYLSPDGDLRATSYDPKSRTVGRSVTLITGVRRDLVGSSQMAVSANGMLAYVSGGNSQIRRMMVLHEGGVPTPLPLEPAPFLRFDLSRDRRWLAAVVQATDRQELRIYDLRNGQSFTWRVADQIRHPLWSRDGSQIATWELTGSRSALVIGSPFVAGALDTLAVSDSTVRAPEIDDFTEPAAMIGIHIGTWIALRIDLATRPAKFDTLAPQALFASVSPDGRRMAYMSEQFERVLISPFPPANSHTQIASGGVEPLWLSATNLLYRSGVSWYRVEIDAATGEVVGTPTLFGRDERFADTPGWSNRLSHDGGIIYLQGTDPDHANSVRLIPNWVAQMKRAVDEANK